MNALILAAVLTFEVAGMTCGMCETNAEKALRGIKGVTSADVDFDTKKATVNATRELTNAEIRRALGKFGFDASFEGDALPQRLSEQERAKLDIRVLSNGEAFDIQKGLALGKVTIVDFWAEWCGPCHVLTPKLEHMVRDEKDVALRTIDLKNWESAAAKQATAQFKLPGLPYVRVYGPNGRFAGEVVGNDIEKIEALVAGARK